MSEKDPNLEYAKYSEYYEKLQDEYKQLRGEIEQDVKTLDAQQDQVKIQSKYELLEKKHNEILDVARKMKSYFPAED